MSFIASPNVGVPSIIPNINAGPYEADPVEEIARRILRLSYRDMKRLAAELSEINTRHSSFSFADGIQEWAEKEVSGAIGINMAGR